MKNHVLIVELKKHKMKLIEILENEKTNPGSVMLYKEGIFWRVYNQSAIWFFENVKRLNLRAKRIKYLGHHILCGGYPDSLHMELMEKVKDSGYNCNISTQITSIDSVNKPSIETLSEYIIKLIEKNEEKQQRESSTLLDNDIVGCREADDEKQDNQSIKMNYELLVDEIMGFSAVSKTPFEAIQFIVNLQNKLK